MEDLLNPDKYKTIPWPPLPPSQALNSKTFRLPPLDGTLNVPELYDWHLEHTPNHPIFVYADDEGKEKLMYWPEASRAVHRAGRLVRSRLRKDGPKRPVVATLCAADTITMFVTEVGIIRADCIVFPISTRNSAAAVAYLLTKIKVTHVLVGSEGPYQTLATAALKIMQDAGTPIPDTSVTFTFEEIMKEDEVFEPLPKLKYEWDDTCAIMHSSGSTAFPKPITWSHWRFLQISVYPFFGEQDFTGMRLGIQALPMYHGMGIMQTGCAASSGVTLAVFKPQIPAIIPTAETLIRSYENTKTDIGFTVPLFAEMWSRDAQNVQVLKKMKGILYGGGPLPKKVGDYLFEQGVSIFILYGLTEGGIINKVIPSKCEADWQYFQFAKSFRPHMVFDEGGAAELVIMPGPHLTPGVLNTTVDGIGAYATSDLLEPHPSKSGYWRVFGRSDDQIMHSNGEKTNPGPLEGILNQDPHIHTSVMFGRGRFNAGVLIDPKPDFKFDPSDTHKLAEFRNLIWPSIERMNDYAPQHSRLFKEMIIVTSPSKPFTYTAKLTLRRQAILNDYDPEIDALYATVAETTTASENITPPTSWNLDETMAFVRQIVASVLKRSIQDTDDVFEKGCDSLQATWLRNSILHALRESAKVNTRGISAAFVFENPTIARLAQFVSHVVNHQSSNGSAAVADSHAVVVSMLEMVDKYTKNFPKHTGKKPLPQKDVVLVTGTTGALGATLLAKLVESPEVEHIYALNRVSADGKSLVDRQQERMSEWGLDPEIVNSSKVTFIESDMSEDHLGVPEALYEEMHTRVTHVIHTAYRVNFALSLSSFDTNVRAARNFVDFALSSPYKYPVKLLFASTIGVAHFYPHPGAIPEGPIPPESAVTNGYAESKWVIERMLQVAQEYTPLHPVSVRIGQITGGAVGAWNKTEWFPALLKSSQYLGCLPTFDKDISWVPVDSMAQAVIEMRNSPEAMLHLVHPRPVTWSQVMEPISRALRLPIVPYSEWLNRLQNSGDKEGNSAASEVQLLQVNPALMLIDFLGHAVSSEADKQKEAMGIRTFEVSKAVKVAPALNEERLPRLANLLNPDNYKVLPFKALPNTQALTSKTFRPPPIDGSLMIPQLYDWHLKHTPNHPLFVYAEDDGTEKIIYWPTAVRAMHRGGRIVQSRLRADLPAKSIIAILCSTDTITTFLTQIGILRLGHSVFPISTRNSSAAVAHLLTKTDVAHLIVGPETPYQQLAADAFKIMRDAGAKTPETSTMLSFEDIMKEDDEPFVLLPEVDIHWDDTALVMHSSDYGGHDLTGFRLGMQPLPMYHAMGMLQSAWAVSSGVVLVTYKPQVPAVTPTPENFIQSIVATKCEAVVCVPIFLEIWARNPSDVKVLSNLKGVMFGGAPLAPKIGDYLAEQGVSLWSLYGLTECGVINHVFPSPSDFNLSDWQYFKVAGVTRAHFAYQADGVAELVVLPGPHATPNVMNTVVDGVGAYSTGDLLQQHPTKPEYWRVYARVDDQIMHNNGEKTNPGPLEAILNQEPHVHICLLFGRNRFNVGVLVDPKPEYKFDPKDTKKLAEFRQLIWPSVEKMNQFAPQHSHVFKEMILVATPSKPFTYTAKLTPRRHAILNEYEEEIEALYATAAETAQAGENIDLPVQWDPQETTVFVRKIVEGVMDRPMRDSDDLFQKGCDSLQATWIRNSILHALREGPKINTRGIPSGFVYDFPTITSLAQLVHGIVHDVEGKTKTAQSPEAIVKAMLQMTEKYTKDFPKHTGKQRLPAKDVVLVTGTTGGLGGALLAYLAQSPEVSHIYALNRPGKDVTNRQKERIREWGFDEELVRSDKIGFLEADMDERNLGLTDAIYEQIRTTVTHIIHNAYRVNFNLSLASFDSNVRAARNLVDLALSSPYASPASLLFTSSIGVTSLCEDRPVKEAPMPPESALSNGYAQSKWVIEHILEVAQEHTSLRTISVRVGQICGSERTGAWNVSEWFPSLLKSSAWLGALPMLNEQYCSWLSVDATARAIIDARNSPHPILNLVHPRPVSWSSLLTPASQILRLPLVPFADWLDRLRESSPGASHHDSADDTDEEAMKANNPGAQLIPFYSFAEKAGPGEEVMGLPTLEVKRMVQVAPSLGEDKLGTLSEADVERWIGYWKKVGFLKA
ncbi:hypothetical protein EUX98_g6169 [Antrodiella citrinella]|uniref:Polyketide synthase-like phosphopantetheine-binding domain-containing protein n=1 Tax=Antrodiella citrinella TaxID=2447956 RepID=A0A4S4MPX9_9APHY|nr:hypothetical protein EUX98_g6169 [Antrodiella citrinella]